MGCDAHHKIVDCGRRRGLTLLRRPGSTVETVWAKNKAARENPTGATSNLHVIVNMEQVCFMRQMPTYTELHFGTLVLPVKDQFDTRDVGTKPTTLRGTLSGQRPRAKTTAARLTTGRLFLEPVTNRSFVTAITRGLNMGAPCWFSESSWEI
jgi:hypothetical protein